MRIQLARFLFVPLFLSIWLAGCSEGRLEVRDGWIMEAPPNATVQAGYLTIENGLGSAMTLVRVKRGPFEKIEIHHTVYDGVSGMAKMVAQEQIRIEAGDEIRFEPGGLHLMLVKPKKVLKEGDSITLTLRFEEGQELNVPFKVRRERFSL